MGTRGRMLLCGAMLLACFCTATAQERVVDLPVKIGSDSGVAFVSNSGTDIDTTACNEVCFTLIAKDKLGNVIRSWNTTGSPTTLNLKNSAANTDTSTRTWNADPLGYSFATITHNGVTLRQAGPNEWSIPNTEFDSLGQCRICLTDTKAERGVQIEVNPTVTSLNQLTEKMNFNAGGTSNYLVEITSQFAGRLAAFLERRFEIVVTPRDRYLNPSSDTVATGFSARWPGEFDRNVPGTSDLLGGIVRLNGSTHYFVAPRIARELGIDELQYMIAYKSGDMAVTGRSDAFAILHHAPNPFRLSSPTEHAVLRFYPKIGYIYYPFTWEQPNPADPFFKIAESRFDGRLVSDSVEYSVVFIDSLTLTRWKKFPSDSAGRKAMLTLGGKQLDTLIEKLSGQKTIIRFNAIWFVDATDGLYTTSSPNALGNHDPHSGFHIELRREVGDSVERLSDPSSLDLSQNFPNPFGPAVFTGRSSTHIRFSIPTSGHVKLRVFDILGALVATPVNEMLEGGTYHATFDASQLPSGTYMYTLQFGDQLLTRRMTVMK